MGYAGKWVERERARELRAESWTLLDIARELGVSKGSVSVWVRDVPFVPRPRNRGHSAHKPHPLTIKKEAEIERCRDEARTVGRERCQRPRADHVLPGPVRRGGWQDPRSITFANTNPTFVADLRSSGCGASSTIDESTIADEDVSPRGPRSGRSELVLERGASGSRHHSSPSRTGRSLMPTRRSNRST